MQTFYPSLMSTTSILGLLSTTIGEEFGTVILGSRANFFQVLTDAWEFDLVVVLVQSWSGIGLGTGLDCAWDYRGELVGLALYDGETCS